MDSYDTYSFELILFKKIIAIVFCVPLFKFATNLIKLDKLPEYLRETVDWFMGKTRRKDRESTNDEQKLYLQVPVLERYVPEPDLVFIIEIPGGLDYNEWLASHTIGFFEQINLIYGTISEFCTLSSCQDMTGPGPRQYLWMDEKGKKSRVCAPQYVDYVMTFVQKSIIDETLFPTKHGQDFPATFDSCIKKIHRLLFHVMAHIYHVHFREILLLQLHAHLNSVFAHFVEFNLRFHTIEDKELEVLSDLVVALKIIAPPINVDEDDDNMGDVLPTDTLDEVVEEEREESSPSSSSSSDMVDISAKTAINVTNEAVHEPSVSSSSEEVVKSEICSNEP